MCTGIVLVLHVRTCGVLVLCVHVLCQHVLCWSYVYMCCVSSMCTGIVLVLRVRTCGVLVLCVHVLCQSYVYMSCASLMCMCCKINAESVYGQRLQGILYI